MGKGNGHDDVVRRFSEIFSGLRRVYGRYDIPPGARPDKRGKLEGVRKDGSPGGSTRHIRPEDGPADAQWLALYADHLAGGHGLGVVPVTDEATARFGAIDDDRYPVDAAAFNELIREKGLPLVVCRTKSAGAHAYLFTRGPVDADLVRSKLLDWEVALGRPKAEVFPKQSRLANENDEGSWINLPYFGGDSSTRYALDPETNEALTLEQFLDLVDRVAVTADQLARIAPTQGRPEGPSDDPFENGPPCLQTLAARGFPEGSRNNALFSVAVYLKKSHPEDWERRLREYNQALMDPPLAEAEVLATAKSVRKKAYSYKCRDNPLQAVCNRAVCLKRDFGVGGGAGDPGVELGELAKMKNDPPTYIWSVNGRRLELTTEQVMNQKAFAKAVFEQLDVMVTAVKQSTWEGILREKLEGLETEEVPEDATREGQLMVQLARFCTGRSVARSLDELLLGKPYTDADRTYFCASDLIQWLGQHRVQTTERDLYRMLRRAGIQSHSGKLKGKTMAYWSVPAFARQTEGHDVPRKSQGEPM